MSSMFSRFKNFLCRHRRKFLVGSLVIGGTILGLNYVQRKFLNWQENEAKEFLKKARKEQHFRNTERTCNQTIFSLSKTLKEMILKLLDSDALLQKIREGADNRITLWEELKIVVFAQICALVYCGMMLVIVLRIQLNIIGGYMIRDNQASDTLSPSSQKKYLSMCQHFLEKGVTDICDLMKKHSQLVLKDISLKQKMTLQDIENIFWRIESSLNQDPLNPLRNLSSYLISSGNGHSLEVNEVQFFKETVAQTVELLQHEHIMSAADSAIKRAFSNTVDKIAEYYVPSKCQNGDVAEETPKLINLTNVTVPFAKTVPILHGLYRGPIDSDCPDPWIEQFILMEQLNALGITVYETFSVEEEF